MGRASLAGIETAPDPDMVSYLFLARVRQELRGEKSGVDGVPGAYGGRGDGAELVVEPESVQKTPGTDGGGDQEDATEKRSGSQEPHQDDATKTSRVGHKAKGRPPLYVGAYLAL